MLCSRCGHLVPSNAKFCSNCGNTLDQETINPHALDGLMRAERYAAVIAATAGHAAPPITAVRVEAQRKFYAGVQQLVTIYRQQQRAGSAPDAYALLPYYQDEIEPIRESFEARAYATALLERAERLVAEHADPDDVRTLIQVARTLPVTDADDIAAAAERLLADIDHRDTLTLAATSYQSNGGSGAEAPADRRTQKLSPLDAPEPLLDPRPTTRLEPTMADEPPASDGPLAVEDSPEDQQALALLQQLEALLLERGDPQRLEALREQARAQIDADSPYHNRLLRAEAQLRALESIPALEALMARPPAEWLAAESDLDAQIDERLAQVEAAFDSDSAIAQALRTQRDQQQQARQQITAKLAGLANLEDIGLVNQLAELEQVLSPAFPGLAEAQRRRRTYLDAQAQLERAESDERNQAAKREEYRQLRVKLDNLIMAPLADPNQIIALRNQAETASQDPMLAGADNPLDPATFAFYDLLCGTRYHDRTRFSEREMQVQTVKGVDDLLGIYRLTKADLAEALHGDNADDLAIAEKNYKDTLENLVAELQRNVALALADAEERLSRFDYATVITNLNAQRQHVQDAEVEIDAELERWITKLLTTAQQLEARDRQVQQRQTQAAEQAPRDSTDPNYPQAIAMLEQAQGVAPWRDAEIDSQIAEMRERQARYVDGMLRRASDARGGGAYDEAERLLQRAEDSAGTDEQQRQIAAQRTTLFQQKENQQHIDRMIQAAQRLAKDAEQGADLDMLAGQIAGERERIGTRENPKLDNATWATLNTFVTLAEERLAIWKAYQGVLSQAEQAAFLGERAALDAAVQKMNSMTEHRFLPIDDDLKRIRKTARANSRSERARQLLSDIREELASPDRSVAPERIYQVLFDTNGLEDEDIIAERQMLDEIYPLYVARAQLAGYAAEKLFDQLKASYEQLSPLIQRDPVISRLVQEADLALRRQQFDQALQSTLRHIYTRLEQGWFNPAAFREAVDDIIAFANAAPPAQRQDHPKLLPAALEQLENLASQLSSARTAYDQYQYPEARLRIKTILQTLPTSEVPATSLLYSYYNDLKYLRQQMQEIERTVGVNVQESDDHQKKYEEAVQSYITCVSEPRTAFSKVELQQTLARFVGLNSPAYQARITEYTTTIAAITGLLQQVNEIEELMIGGAAAASGDRDNAAGPSRNRKKQVEAKLNEALNAAQTIRNSVQGVAWLGITDDLKYQALREYMWLAGALEAADHWLSQTANLNQNLARLIELRADFEELQALNLKSKDQDALRRANLNRLAESCEDHWLRLSRRRADLQRAIDQCKATRRRNVRWVGGVLTLALLGLGAWSTPTTRQAIVVAAVGTLTPLPTQTAEPTASSDPAAVGPTLQVVTATPIPTETPIPTATPVPPQAGIVTVPGRVNVRAQPDTSLPELTFIEVGNRVQVTGFATAPSGARWYRIDAPTRNLSNVWLLAQVTVQGRTYETVSFDGGEQLRPELQIPFNP